MGYRKTRKGKSRSSSSIRRGKTYKGRYRIEFYDPEGTEHDGIPTYPWKMAPEGLATKRQLLAEEKRPGRQPIAGQILWVRYGKVCFANLYRKAFAEPKRTPTLAQLFSIEKALEARRTCPNCRTDVGYTIPTRYGQCLDCHERTAA